MYIAMNVENIVTIGVILLCWMLALHLAGQLGVNVSKYLGS